MATEITLADVDQAEAALRDAKESGQHKAVAPQVTALRRAYREQEEQAGRRSGFVATEEG